MSANKVTIEGLESGEGFNMKVTYREFTQKMREWNNRHRGTDNQVLSGVIVFKASNWPGKDYSLLSRSYGTCSNNKAWISGMGGYSIYAGSLDGSDPCVRLEGYIKEEGNGDRGWEVEYCYFTKVTN